MDKAPRLPARARGSLHLHSLVLAVLLCPADMVEIPAGTWTLGQDESGEPWIPAARAVALESFCVDRYEYPNEAGELPLVNVEWTDAAARCESQGKRLCRSDEWERACRGAAGTRYAYGDAFEPGRCNTDLEGGHGPEGPPYAAAGAFEACVSPEGVFVLNGNVSEWVAEAWDATRFGDAEGQGDGPAHTNLKQLRGGTMWSGTFYGQSCLSRHAHPAHTTSDDDGFRCCKSQPGPSPATVALPPEPPPEPRRSWLPIAAAAAALALAGGVVWQRSRRG